MHRQVASLLSTSSPGRLARLGTALGKAGIDIATTGGAEWKHSGPVTLMIKDDWGTGTDDQMRAFAKVMASEKVPWIALRTIEFELTDVPGSLGAAATALGKINIYAVSILEIRDGKAVVGLGVRPTQVGAAIKALKKYGAALRRHPNDPDDGWWDEWDDRTEELLGHFDDPNVPPNDPMFYVLKTQTRRGAGQRR
jgi:hypothetical protein